jgi:hypothetical protein
VYLETAQFSCNLVELTQLASAELEIVLSAGLPPQEADPIAATRKSLAASAKNFWKTTV